MPSGPGAAVATGWGQEGVQRAEGPSPTGPQVPATRLGPGIEASGSGAVLDPTSLTSLLLLPGLRLPRGAWAAPMNKEGRPPPRTSLGEAPGIGREEVGERRSVLPSPLPTSPRPPGLRPHLGEMQTPEKLPGIWNLSLGDNALPWVWSGDTALPWVLSIALGVIRRPSGPDTQLSQEPCPSQAVTLVWLLGGFHPQGRERQDSAGTQARPCIPQVCCSVSPVEAKPSCSRTSCLRLRQGP